MPRSGGLYYVSQETQRVRSAAQLVLIHGAGGSSASWPYQLRRLPGWQVIAPDLPGHGRSESPAPGTLQAYAELLWEWLDGLGIERPVLCGHSMGAAIALRMAQSAPQRTRGLVLLGAAARFSVNPHLLEKLAHPTRLQEGLRNITQWSFARRAHLALRNAHTRQLQATPHKQLLADFKICAEFDFSQAAGSLRTPALVLCGAEDQMVSPHLSGELAKQLPSGQLLSIPSAGHMLMLERPAEVTAALEAAMQTWK